MLQINPYFRPSAKELLNNPYFDDVRIAELESATPPKLNLQIDSDHLVDSETAQHKLSTEEVCK